MKLPQQAKAPAALDAYWTLTIDQLLNGNQRAQWYGAGVDRADWYV